MGSKETVRFGEENDPELEKPGRSHDSIDLDETQEGDDQYDDANSGTDETLRGYGSATLLECCRRLGAQPNTTALASKGSKREAPPNQPDPPQVMSPSLSQTLRQDSAPVRHPPPVDTHIQPVVHQRKKEELRCRRRT